MSGWTRIGAIEKAVAVQAADHDEMWSGDGTARQTRTRSGCERLNLFGGIIGVGINGVPRDFGSDGGACGRLCCREPRGVPAQASMYRVMSAIVLLYPWSDKSTIA